MKLIPTDYDELQFSIKYYFWIHLLCGNFLETDQTIDEYNKSMYDRVPNPLIETIYKFKNKGQLIELYEQVRQIILNYMVNNYSSKNFRVVTYRNSDNSVASVECVMSFNSFSNFEDIVVVKGSFEYCGFDQVYSAIRYELLEDVFREKETIFDGYSHRTVVEEMNFKSWSMND